MMMMMMMMMKMKELLHPGLHTHLQGQYSIPFPFLCCEKRKAEILRADTNKRLIQV
jgi:hypothetical protein